MSVAILEDPDRSVRPEGAVRADVAWKLFMPKAMGDVSFSGRNDAQKLTRWLWTELSERMGFLKVDSNGMVYVITPALTAPARDLLLRICSMWSNEVYLIKGAAEGTDLRTHGENLWIAPKVNTLDPPEEGSVLNAMTSRHHGSFATFMMPALGSSRASMRTYLIENGKSYARLHSHSAVEEHYLVLSGEGTLRYGNHADPLKEGDLVSKPVGPDNFTQFIADKGSEMRILDIEIWPDTNKNAKDVVFCPDHREIILRGEGWGAMVPVDALIDPGEFGRNYESGYVRQKDGSWVPSRIPGFPERIRDMGSE